MSKKIILLSDGTGNSAAKVWKTNVWRVFESLDLGGDAQVAYYDDGVGTSSFKPMAVLGGAFGVGLKRNVISIYKFACRNYAPGDELYGFGFSRGAFTIRVVVGLMINQGLVQAETESDLHRNAVAAYRAYRREKFHTRWRIERPFRWLRDWILHDPYTKKHNRPVDSIRFLGLWDTVEAYGLPVDEMTQGINEWVWPLALPDRILKVEVERVCHALSLDDPRQTFRPVLWDERNIAQPIQSGPRTIADERLSQVWFAGVHSNVGGGYPDDSLAYIPLLWIMTEARRCGLAFKASPSADPDAFKFVESLGDCDGRLYDPRSGLGGIYRYGPRKLADLCDTRSSSRAGDTVYVARPKIHISVFKRIERGAHAYAPLGLPADYDVVSENGTIMPATTCEGPGQAGARAARQETAWRWVSYQRYVYFLMLGVAGWLLTYPLIRALPKTDEYTSRLRWISDLIRLAGTMLPALADPWVNGYARSPGHFVVYALIVAALVRGGSSIQARNADRMQRLWRCSLDGRLTLSAETHSTLAVVVARWRRVAAWLHCSFLPAISAAGIVYLVAALSSHLLFNVQDTYGLVCQEKSGGAIMSPGQSHKVTLRSNDLCLDTGIDLELGVGYQFAFTITEPLRDGGISVVERGGYYTDDAPWYVRPLLLLGVPLRRKLLRPWFRIVGRYGSTGGEEVFFDPDASGGINSFIHATRDGRLFFFVNDAVIGIPGLYDVFYGNNAGTIQVTVTRPCPSRPASAPDTCARP